MSSIQKTLQKRIEKAGLEGSHKITFKKGFHKDGLVFPNEDTLYTIKGKECGKKEILEILNTDNLCPFYNFGINGETGEMFSLYSYFYYFKKILKQEKFTQGTNCDGDITLNLKDNREQVIEKVKFSFQELFMNNCSLPTKISKGMSKPVFTLNVRPLPNTRKRKPIFLDDARAVDLIRFMRHKFITVDKFLKDNPKLKVIIPADYQFYFEEKKGEFTAFKEEINKIMNKYIYSNKLKFNLVMGHFEYKIILDIKSFRGSQTNLKTKTVREIRIGFKQETNLGKGLAIKQWNTSFGNNIRYEEFITILDENVRMLCEKYNTRVEFGTLNNTLNNKDILQLWGANMKNYDCFTENGFTIKGIGQAGYLRRHSVSTFGIVTTPVGGTPTLDDMGKRLYNRNTGKLTTKPMGASTMGSMGASAMGSMGAAASTTSATAMGASGTAASTMGASAPAVIEDPFKPCEKTKEDPFADRKPKDFLKNLVEGNRDSIDIALTDLTKGTKTNHWVWAIFPQPLNVYDKLSNYPTENSIKYGFNSYIEVELFLMTPELVYNYTVCLELLLKAMSTKKTLRHILGYDNVKVISSVKYINKAIERFLSLGKSSEKVLELQELIQKFLTTIDKGKVLGRKRSKKKKKSKNKKSKINRKTNKNNP